MLTVGDDFELAGDSDEGGGEFRTRPEEQPTIPTGVIPIERITALIKAWHRELDRAFDSAA